MSVWVMGSRFLSIAGSTPSAVTILPWISTPVRPLKPNMWSKERFSSMSTKTCSICAVLSPPPENKDASQRQKPSRAHRIVSQARQTVWRTQPKIAQVHLTTQANALQTHFATQYHALQTHFATQYQARQKKPAIQS